MKMPFGKYKGEDVCDLPIDYIKWLEEQDWVRDELRKELQHEIEKHDGDRPGKGIQRNHIKI